MEDREIGRSAFETERLLTKNTPQLKYCTVPFCRTVQQHQTVVILYCFVFVRENDCRGDLLCHDSSPVDFSP